MTATTNEVTGDKIKTGAASQEYLDNFDAIFSNKVTEDTKKPTTIGPSI